MHFIKSWLKNGVADGQAIFINIAAAIDEDDEIVDVPSLQAYEHPSSRFQTRPKRSNSCSQTS
jgi:hypothetical protein